MANNNKNNQTQQTAAPDTAAELEQLKAQLAQAEKQAAEATARAAAAEEELKKGTSSETAENKAKPKTVKIRIPKMRKDESDVFVSVNDYTCIVKRGVEVEVPDFIAEVLQHREEMVELIALAGEK